MNQPTEYSSEWFSKQKVGSLNSAEIILPIVFDLVSPKSIVDVGCGVGAWLACALKLGIEGVLGLDGSWIKGGELLIPKEFFKAVDINEAFDIGRKADMAICLEVGEHLPETRAESLVKSLTVCSPVVLFSAAIPFQPGTNHINGQWPEYWAKLFKAEGYIPVDAIRRKVWTNPNVEYWYAQNVLLYVKESELTKYPKLEKEISCGYGSALPLVHPRRYFYALQPPPTIIFRLIRKIRFIFKSLLS